MSYNANDIETLSFLQAVRERVAMYMGSADNQGVLQCAREIITNVLDEKTMGFGSFIIVELDEGNKLTITDEARGVPFGLREDGTEAMEALYTMPHTGGKFNEKIYQNVAGQNGIGAKGVALSSSYFKADSYRDGKHATLILKDGVKQSFTVVKENHKSGTVVSFIPSQEVYNLEPISIKFEDLKEMCRNWSYLTKGFKFILINKVTGEKVEYLCENGILDFLKDSVTKPIHRVPLYTTINENGIECEIAMQWSSDRREHWYVFTNGLANAEGGTSLTGVKTSLTNFFKKKFKGEVNTEVARNGLFYVINCKIPNPSFANQTKTKVNNPELRGLCQRATTKMLEDFEHYHAAEFEQIINLLTREIKADAVAEKARQAVLNNEKEQEKISKQKIVNVDKLLDARELGENSVLVLCEGDSAGGSMRLGRDVNKYGVLMLRGKCINLLNCPIEEGLNNEEVKLMQQAIGAPYGKKITTPRYGKYALGVDADFDGSHIALLIIADLAILQPSILVENRLYWLRAPIYVVRTKTKNYYYYTEEEFQAGHPSGDVLKFKGLGQMSKDDLRNSMFNEATQRLEPIKFSEEGLEVLKKLMGEDVEYRREFIFKNIDFEKFVIG